MKTHLPANFSPHTVVTEATGLNVALFKIVATGNPAEHLAT